MCTHRKCKESLHTHCLHCWRWITTSTDAATAATNANAIFNDWGKPVLQGPKPHWRDGSRHVLYFA
jgi:hypothetical protein